MDHVNDICHVGERAEVKKYDDNLKMEGSFEGRQQQVNIHYIGTD